MIKLGFVVAFAVALSACGERDDCDYRVCDIERESCVNAVAKTVACQRGVETLVPEVRFLTREEVLAEWNAEPLTPEELERQRELFVAQSRVGLMPENYQPGQVSLDQLDNVAAYYSRDTGEVTIISDSSLDDRELAYEILVHEMTHVYQDSAFDLDALGEAHGTSLDRALGLRAAIEGDAQLQESFAAIALLGWTPDEVDWNRYFVDFESAMLERAAMSDTPALDTFAFFPYAFGEHYLHGAWLDVDDLASETVLLDPPDSVRQVLRRYPGRSRPDINEDALLEPTAVPVLPGYTFIGGDHFGNWLLNAMLQRTAADTALYDPALDAVGSDYWSAFRHDASGEVVVVWRIRGGPAIAPVLDQAGSMWSSLSADTTRSWHAIDGDVVLVATAAGTDSHELFASIERWQSPREAAGTAGVDGALRRIAEDPWSCALP